MCCIDYLKNFYNDHQFKINRFAILLPKVLNVGNQMIVKFSSDSIGGEAELKFKAMNEVLELFRLVVEKYSGFTVMQPDGKLADNSHLSELTQFLNQYWTKYTSDFHGSDQDPEAENPSQKEQTLIISSIMRIMSHILARLPLHDIPKAQQVQVEQILEVAFKQAIEALTLSKRDYVLSEFSFSFIGCLARVL